MIQGVFHRAHLIYYFQEPRAPARNAGMQDHQHPREAAGKQLLFLRDGIPVSVTAEPRALSSPNKDSPSCFGFCSLDRVRAWCPCAFRWLSLVHGG